MGATAKQLPFSRPVFAATTNAAAKLASDVGSTYMLGDGFSPKEKSRKSTKVAMMKGL